MTAFRPRLILLILICIFTTYIVNEGKSKVVEPKKRELLGRASKIEKKIRKGKTSDFVQ